MSKLTMIGLDIAKNMFHALGVDTNNETSLRRKLRRSQVEGFFHKQPPCLIVMEACGSAYYWARRFQTMGHEVKLLPPQHVKGYLRGQKNDFNDALALVEAQLHGKLRPVAIKTAEQQDEQARHRMRSLLIKERSAQANHIRSFLYERGIILRLGVSVVNTQVPLILEDAQNDLTPVGRELLEQLYQHFERLSDKIQWFTRAIEKQVKEDEVGARLLEIPGFGPIVTSAFKSWMGAGRQFRRGRDASAALGVVPRQHSTGGKDRLLGITKRGDPYVRSLVIHGARSVVSRASKKNDPLSQWVNSLVARRGYNKATVALANKMIRIAWVMVARGESYQPQRLLA